jgi:hypothetical protein
MNLDLLCQGSFEGGWVIQGFLHPSLHFLMNSHLISVFPETYFGFAATFLERKHGLSQKKYCTISIDLQGDFFNLCNIFVS